MRDDRGARVRACEWVEIARSAGDTRGTKTIDAALVAATPGWVRLAVPVAWAVSVGCVVVGVAGLWLTNSQTAGWVVTVGVWLLFAVLVAPQLISIVRKRSMIAHLGICATCAYNLDGCTIESDGCTVCPECGAAWRVGEP